MLILFSTMATAFLGYLLPYGEVWLFAVNMTTEIVSDIFWPTKGIIHCFHPTFSRLTNKRKVDNDLSEPSKKNEGLRWSL